MIHSTEKLKPPGHEEVRTAGEGKGSSDNKVKMFVCEQHVKLWITSKPKVELAKE